MLSANSKTLFTNCRGSSDKWPPPTPPVMLGARMVHGVVKPGNCLTPASGGQSSLSEQRSKVGLLPNFDCPPLAGVKQFPGFTTPWTIRAPSITGGVGGGHLSEDPRQFVNNVFEFADNISYMR